ncbi:hypothetical protein X747_14955 [Mesorhizobium sp. LNJC384A00]|uniref:hypothetical protein n=1 Tax=unclassified Mesorhizobium TaxID=325217 RepID=UPI0003CF071C|nr:hypothetical protein [Mesorhizobium sp. LNJC384A00]ESY42064.1 hypothetical protein X747_14955 [Mesorhizobium sp. LNJC384A00]
MNDEPVYVSDHAIILYLQLILGVDIEQLRAHIADAARRHQGAPCVKALGARFLLVNGRVVTTIGGHSVPGYEFLTRLMRDGEAEVV